MPLDSLGQHLRLLTQLLGIVLSKVELLGRRFMKGDDVVGRLQFGDADKPDLDDMTFVSGDVWSQAMRNTGKLTFRPLATAAILSLTPWI